MQADTRSERFNHLMKRWIEHCSHPRVHKSERARAVWNCKPYYLIVKLGKDVLPLIRQSYASDVSSFVPEPSRENRIAYDVIRSFGLEAVITTLCDGFSVPEDARGTDYERIENRRAYTQRWLADYLSDAPSARSTQPRSR